MKAYFQRFGIPLDLAKTQKIFENKVSNILFQSRAFEGVVAQRDMCWDMCNRLGLEARYKSTLRDCFDHRSFNEFLLRLQCLFDILWERIAAESEDNAGSADEGRFKLLCEIIGDAIKSSPINLGIRLSISAEDGAKILIAGSKKLDKEIVDDVLGILESDASLKGVHTAFLHGLKDYVEAQGEDRKLRSAVRNMQLAGDEMVKYKLGNKKLRLANLFQRKNDKENWILAGLNNYQKNFYSGLDTYMDECAKHNATYPISPKDVEMVIYMMGALIRHVVI